MFEDYDRTNGNLIVASSINNQKQSRLRLFLFLVKQESTQSMIGPFLESTMKKFVESSQIRLNHRLSNPNPNQVIMVTGSSSNNNNNLTRAAAANGSWGTTTVSGSGQSISTSGSVGSPSMATTPVTHATFFRLNSLDIHGDDAASQATITTVNGKSKKKRAQRAVGGDKSGRGLRQFSMKVCEKVESKGRTTYNEVADELVTEFSDPSSNVASPDQQQQYDEKNIRRRVYDALNVLMAMDIISKDKKEIQWRGLPRTSLTDVEQLKRERVALRDRIEKKAGYLRELEEQFLGLQNLIQRNEQLYNSGNAPTGGVNLPFILVQTRPHATVEVEISEDMQLVHFDFSSTPFELRDDNYFLKAMKFCGTPQSDDEAGHNYNTDGVEDSSMISGMYEQQFLPPNRKMTPTRHPTSPPLPGIIKARAKPENSSASLNIA